MPGNSYDRIKTPYNTGVQFVFPDIDFMKAYDSKVISQSADMLSVDIQPADNSLPGMNNVPIVIGVAGVTVKLIPGAIVKLMFEGGSPAGAYVTGFRSEQIETITITALTTVNLGGTGGDNVATKDDLTALITAIGSGLTSATGGAVTWVTTPVPVCSTIVLAKRS